MMKPTNWQPIFFCFFKKQKTKQTKYTVCICMIIQKSYNGFLCRWFLYQIERIKRRWNEMRERNKSQQYRTLTTKQQIERVVWLIGQDERPKQQSWADEGDDKRRRQTRENEKKNSIENQDSHFFPSTQRCSTCSSSPFSRRFNG